VEHIVTVYKSFQNKIPVFILVVVRIYGVNEKLRYIRNSCVVKSTHQTVCWINNKSYLKSPITCDRTSYYIIIGRRVSHSNRDQATSWTTEESSFDSWQGKRDFSLLSQSPDQLRAEESPSTKAMKYQLSYHCVRFFKP
jgi:hypothetical protein